MINVIWPTVRPEIAMAQSQKWLDAANDPGQVNIEFGVNSDVDAEKIRIDAFRSICVVPGLPPGITATATFMTRNAMKEAPDDGVVVLASDDFEAPEGWDDHLLDQTGPGAIIVNDGYAVSTDIIPLPVVTGAYLRKLNGIIYHPAYHHFFSDQELFDIVSKLGAVNLRGTKCPAFSHKHWSFAGRKKDEFDVRNSAWWNQDKATYEKRKTWSVEQCLELSGY